MTHAIGMSSRTLVTLAAALLPALAACSTIPTVQAAQDAVAERIDNGDTARLQIVEFNKTDGQAGEVFGVAVYSMKFEATAVFVEDALYRRSGNILVESRINTMPATQRQASCAQDMRACFEATPESAKKGDRLRIEGSVDFEKSEAGWRVILLKFTAVPASAGSE